MGMIGVILKISARNVWRQKKRSFLLAGAIAFGMFVITAINGLTGGVVDNIRVNFSHALGGHVFISGSEYLDRGTIVYRIADDEKLLTALQQNGESIAAVTRRSQAMPSLIFGSRQAMQLVYGVDFQQEDKLLGSLVVTGGSLKDVTNEQLIILPRSVAERLGVEAGETILMRLDTVTGQRNVGEFVVVALIEDQERYGISAAYVNRGYLNTLVGLGLEDYQALNLFLTDMEQADALGQSFRAALGVPEPKRLAEVQDMDDEEAMAAMFGFTRASEVEPWEGIKYQVTTINQIMEPVEAAVNALKTIGLAIFIILLVITMVGITNTFRMIMIERTKEIGTMRAFGMQRGVVRNVFLMEALLLSAGGALAGLIAYGLAAFILGRISWDTVPAMQFFLDQGRITFTASFREITFNTSLILAMGLLAAYFPAKAAAKLSPVKAMSSNL
jgi:putative ABC transport system permease protein